MSSNLWIRTYEEGWLGSLYIRWGIWILDLCNVVDTVSIAL